MSTYQINKLLQTAGVLIFLISFLLIGQFVSAQTYYKDDSYTIVPPNGVVNIGTSKPFWVDLRYANDIPNNAIITKVEAKFDYIAYGVVQNYVSVRFNKDTDPGTSGGIVLVSKGSLPSNNPGTYGYYSFSNWNGQSNIKTVYYFNFNLASGSPFTCTINKIYIRISYSLPDNFPTFQSPYLQGSANIPEKIYLSGSADDDIALKEISMIVSGPRGSNITAFTEPLNSIKSKSLSSYYFDSNHSTYSGRAGNYAIKLNIKDTKDQVTSHSFNVTASNLPPPTLISPSGDVEANKNITFSWYDAPNAARYRLKICTDQAMMSQISGSPFEPPLGDKSYTVGSSKFIQGQTYYWQVGSILANDVGGWGDYGPVSPWAIKIAVERPVAPTLISPSGDVEANRNITFSWNDAPNAARYRLKICTDQAMTNQISGSPFEPPLGDKSYTVGSSNFIQGQTYYWQVGSILADDVGGWGDYGPASPWAIKIAPAPFELLYPAQNQIQSSSEIEFSWAPVTNALKYELYVDNNLGLGSCEVAPKNIPELKNLTVTSYQLGGNWLNQNVYYWQVWAIRKGDTIKSETGSFIYLPPKSTCPQWAPIFRLFKPSIVDHFYCTNSLHREVAEADGYLLEKEEGFISVVPFEVKSPDTLRCLYRFAVPANNGVKTTCHYYTSNDNDRDYRIKNGMIFEGIIGYTYKLYQSGLDPLWHVYLNQSSPDYRRDNFYTTSKFEADYAHDIFRYNGAGPDIVAYVSKYDRNANIPWISNNPEIGSGINPVNGIFAHYEKSGFQIPGAKTSLDFSVTYTSSRALLGDILINPLGIGWSHNYNSYVFTDDCWAYVCWGNGDIYKYHLNDFSPEIKLTYDVFSQPTSTSFQITRKDKTLYQFEKLNSSDNIYFLKSIVDRNENKIRLQYDNNQQLLSVDSPENRGLSFSYDGKGLLTQVKDPVGRTIKFDYSNDGLNNLVKYTDAKNQETSYTYLDVIKDDLTLNSDFSHLLETVKLPIGNIIRNAYNTSSKPVRVEEQSFSMAGRTVKTQIGIPTSNSVSFKVGANNAININLVPIDFPKKLFNVSEISTSKAKYEYDINGYNPSLPNKIIDGNGNTTTITYDNFGNPTEVNQSGTRHLYEYNTFSEVKKYTDPLNHSYVLEYDDKGNIMSFSSPKGIKTVYANNSDGTINKISNPLGASQSFSYNNFGNVSHIKDNLGNTTVFGYDPVSRITSVKDALGNTTKYTFDNNDLMTDVFDPLNNNTHYTYNANDLLTGVRNALQKNTSLEYDNNSQLTSIANPLNDKSHIQYCQNGLDSVYTTPNGEVFRYYYDKFYRLKNVTANGLNRTITYDGNDNVKSIADQSGTMEFAYDNLNRMISNKYDNNEITYTYDNAGNILTITYPEGKEVNYEYDNDNLLKSVTDWNARKTSYFYRDDNSLDNIKYANGTTCNFNYDEAGRLTSMYNFKSNGDTINFYSYQLDPVANQLSTKQTEPFGSFPLQPDSVNYSYNDANRLISAGNASFTYDKNGNLKTESGNGTTTNYNWDAEGRLTGITGKINASYAYDGLGNRRSSSINGVQRKYVLDLNSSMSQVLVETDGNGNILDYYIYGIGLIERIKADGTTTHCYHYDSRGSVIALTDQNQNITHQYSYGPFGELYQKQEADINPFRYVGQWGVSFDSDDLYFMRARYYNPKVGRFISEDPVWDVNLYSYAHNNPINSFDPAGKVPQLLISAMFEVPSMYYKFNYSTFLNFQAILAYNRKDMVAFRILSQEADDAFFNAYRDAALSLTMSKLVPNLKGGSNAKMFGKTGFLKLVDMRLVKNKIFFNQLINNALDKLLNKKLIDPILYKSNKYKQS